MGCLGLPKALLYVGNWDWNQKEQIVVKFDKEITSSRAILALTFDYPLKQGLSGFYMSRFTGEH